MDEYLIDSGQIERVGEPARMFVQTMLNRARAYKEQSGAPAKDGGVPGGACSTTGAESIFVPEMLVEQTSQAAEQGRAIDHAALAKQLRRDLKKAPGTSPGSARQASFNLLPEAPCRF